MEKAFYNDQFVVAFLLDRVRLQGLLFSVFNILPPPTADMYLCMWVCLLMLVGNDVDEFREGSERSRVVRLGTRPLA